MLPRYSTGYNLPQKHHGMLPSFEQLKKQGKHRPESTTKSRHGCLKVIGWLFLVAIILIVVSVPILFGLLVTGTLDEIQPIATNPLYLEVLSILWEQHIISPPIHVTIDKIQVQSDHDPLPWSIFATGGPGDIVLSISGMGHISSRTLWHNQVALASSLRPWL